MKPATILLMVDLIAHMIAQLGYWGIFVVMFVETIFPPIPSELVLPLAGYSAYRGELNVFGVITAGTLGSLAGAGCFYALGRSLQSHKIEAWVVRYGKWLGLRAKDITKSQQWFTQHGLVAIFFARLLPGMRSLISIPAGVHRIRPLPFFILSLLGTTTWTLLLVWGGYILGNQYHLIAQQIKPLSYIVIMLVTFSLGLLLWRRLGGIKKNKKNTKK